MGDLNVPAHVRELRAAGYDSTITLEVFARDRQFLAYSRDRLRELWAEAAYSLQAQDLAAKNA